MSGSSEKFLPITEIRLKPAVAEGCGLIRILVQEKIFVVENDKLFPPQGQFKCFGHKKPHMQRRPSNVKIRNPLMDLEGGGGSFIILSGRKSIFIV